MMSNLMFAETCFVAPIDTQNLSQTFLLLSIGNLQPEQECLALCFCDWFLNAFAGFLHFGDLLTVDGLQTECSVS